MSLESATYIHDLAPANPLGTDPKSQGDDHLRLLKTVAQNTFPGFVGIVAATATESGSGNAYALTLSPAPAAYTALVGSVVLFKATHANTGASTLNVNTLGTKAIVDVNGGALASGDIASGSMVALFYDGTSFCLISANDRAPIDSPTFTGTPAAPTPSASDNTTKLATTAYVDRADALKANLASPTFSGTPRAPTASPSTNTTQLATTAFVQQQAFAAALPVQSGATGKFLTTDGVNASWANLTNLVTTETTDFSVASADRYTLFEFTGSSASTASLPAAATAGNGFIAYFRNVGSAYLTFDPNASETITTEDGTARTTTRLYQREYAILICDGTGWRILRRGGRFLITTTTVSGTVTAVAFETGFDDAEITRFDLIANDIVQVASVPTLKAKSGGSYGATYATLASGVVTALNFRAVIEAPAGLGLTTVSSPSNASDVTTTAGVTMQGVEYVNGGSNITAGTFNFYGYR